MSGSQHLQCGSSWGVGCNCNGLCPKRAKIGWPVNWQQGRGHLRFIDAHSEQRLFTSAQMTEKGIAGCDRKVSENKELYLWVFMVTPVHHQYVYKRHVSIKTGPLSNEDGALVWWITFSFAPCGQPGVWVTYQEKRWDQDAMWRRQAVWRGQCDALGNFLLGDLQSWHSWGCYCNAYVLANIFADCAHPVVLSNGCGLFQQDNVHKLFWNGLRNISSRGRPHQISALDKQGPPLNCC